MSAFLAALACDLLAAALLFGRKVRRSRTMEDAAPWFALMAASCLGAMWAALAAGGAL